MAELGEDSCVLMGPELAPEELLCRAFSLARLGVGRLGRSGAECWGCMCRLLADGIDASGHRFPRVPARLSEEEEAAETAEEKQERLRRAGMAVRPSAQLRLRTA